MAKLTRGILNNNPANIKKGSRWKGLLTLQDCSDPHTAHLSHYDPIFCQFVSVEYGIRALVVLLRTYYKKYHLNTIEKILSRFCPDNTLSSYIPFVVSKMNEYDKEHSYTKDVPLVLGFGGSSSACHVRTLYFLCRSICLIESNYTLSFHVFTVALKLL